jgi:hypothetical protein
MTAEEVAAIHVACRLGQRYMLFDNPLTQCRESWHAGCLIAWDSAIDLELSTSFARFGTFFVPYYADTKS